ncbi:unnamed protein product, partial [Aphanomyces euteiches]
VKECNGNANLILPNGGQTHGSNGTAYIEISNGKTNNMLTLDNVAFEPSIYKNLISHIQLLKMGYRLVKQDLNEAIYQRNDQPRVLVFNQRRSSQVNAVKTDDNLIRWHKKLNHASCDQLAKIIKPIIDKEEDVATLYL